jgi:hypothetical protein
LNFFYRWHSQRRLVLTWVRPCRRMRPGMFDDLFFVSFLYAQVAYNASKWANIQQQDTDIMFMVSQFDGDLFQGLTVLQGIFVDMKENIMVQLHSDNRVFFSSYMCTIIIIFYLMVFRSTVKKSIDETKRVRKFIDMMPTHILTKDECADIIKYFKSP